jgi:hypothetical protein
MNQKIHYLKHRNSDYLAGTDLEIFELEGNSKTLTVERVEYKENFKVNGKNKEKGIVAYFKEKYAKPMIVNPTNSRFIHEKTGVIDAGKWVGFSFELYLNMSVQMRISKTETLKGGISIKSVNVNGLIADIKDLNARIEECSSRIELLSIWNQLTEAQQIEYKTIVTAKNKTF